jgi:hypothetical protein
VQSTFVGHPFCTYIGDSGPGEANDDNLNLDGGLCARERHPEAGEPASETGPSVRVSVPSCGTR